MTSRDKVTLERVIAKLDLALTNARIVAGNAHLHRVRTDLTLAEGELARRALASAIDGTVLR